MGCYDQNDNYVSSADELAYLKGDAPAPPSLEDGAGPWGTEVYCGRCGGSTEFVRCPDCDGGWAGHDCGEDCCACLDPDPNVLCLTCDGEGGSRHCTNSPEWCAANPLPGRESVSSTALNNQAWRDVL